MDENYEISLGEQALEKKRKLYTDVAIQEIERLTEEVDLLTIQLGEKEKKLNRLVVLTPSIILNKIKLGGGQNGYRYSIEFYD